MSSTNAALHDLWKLGFHLCAPAGWVNDPNGLCQVGGTYHVFMQYSPDWPAAGAERGWGHFASRDLLSWDFLGWALRADTPFDSCGAYSGCAVALTDAGAAPGKKDATAPQPVRLYYTGNVKEPGDHDYVRSGRGANVILVRTDAARLCEPGQPGPKEVLLTNADYPAFCSCHVRDPKVWREPDGSWRMILGARDLDDRGLVLVYASADGLAWELTGTIRPAGERDFGYMWECPDRIELGGREWLGLCPQGMGDRSWANGIRDQSGYVPLPEGARVGDAPDVDVEGFRRWDAGFDFYAPQTFVDEGGRTLLVGWMGLPEPPFECAPEGLGWAGCLTVPRELRALPDGTLAQLPARELEGLRGEARHLEAGAPLALPGRRADVLVEGIEGACELVLDDALALRVDRTGRVRLEFLDARVGAGRAVREAAGAGPVRDLRVLVDGSAVEVFADGGRTVLSTRWFPRASRLTIGLAGTVGTATAWPL